MNFFRNICKFALFSISLIFTTPSLASDHFITKGDVTFHFKGQSGQIGIFDKHQREASIKWKKIEEFDSYNNKVDFVNNFASQTFNWGLPIETIINGNNCTLVKFSSILNTKNDKLHNVYFNITTQIFSEDTFIQYGNTTITVPKNVVKFDLSITNWPFKNVNNTLHFGAEMRQSKLKEIKEFKVNKLNKVRSKDSNDDRVVIVDKDSFYDMPSIALINGIETDIGVDLYNDTDDGKIGIRWMFPYFNNLIYDPVVGTGSPSYIDLTSDSYSKYNINYITVLCLVSSILHSKYLL
jgi:hypothetical protein